MNYFDPNMSNSTNTMVQFAERRQWSRSHIIYAGVEFKQKFQLDSRTSRYKNQLAPPDILLARPSWGQLLKII
jgi:hypothetical protein